MKESSVTLINLTHIYHSLREDPRSLQERKSIERKAVGLFGVGWILSVNLLEEKEDRVRIKGDFTELISTTDSC